MIFNFTDRKALETRCGGQVKGINTPQAGRPATVTLTSKELRYLLDHPQYMHAIANTLQHIE